MYELCGQEKKIVDKVNRTHNQLSPTVIFNLSAALSWKIGLFNVTVRDYGKSVVLKAIEKMSPYQVVPILSATPAGFKHKKYDKKLSNHRSIVTTDELGAVVLSSYDLENYLVFLSQLIYDERYDGITTRQASIENAKVVVLGATTPGTFEKVMRSPSWEEVCCERFIRFNPFYHNNPTETVEEPPAVSLKNHFPENLKWKVSREKYKEVYRILRGQLSPRRADLTTRKLLTGHARVRRDDHVTDTDADWFLSYPFMETEKYWVTRQFQITKGWIRTSPPLYNRAMPEVLYWCSLYPQTYETLYINTQGYSKILCQAVISKFLEKKWMQRKTIHGTKTFTISGTFKSRIDKLFEIYDCLGTSDKEAFDEMN